MGVQDFAVPEKWVSRIIGFTPRKCYEKWVSRILSRILINAGCSTRNIFHLLTAAGMAH
jgi:hypothetical protein